MKKNRKNDLRSWMEKSAENQTAILIVWIVFVLIIVVILGVSSLFILKASISTDLLQNDRLIILHSGELIILFVCLILFISTVWVTIRKARIIVPENCIVLLECFNKFVGEKTDTLQESKGVIRKGLHFVFPHFKIFKIHNDVAYYLGSMEIGLFENVDKKNEFPINLKDTAVNLSVTVVARMFNPILAAYNVSNYKSLVVKKCEAAIIKKANKYSLSTLLEFREYLSLDSVFPKFDSGEKNIEIKTIEENMGIELLEIIVTDIGVQKKDQEYKTKIFQAENEQKAMDIENKTLIAREETKAKILAIKTTADKGRIEGLSDANASNIKKTKKAEGEAIKEFKIDTDFDNKEVIAKDALGAIKDSDKLLIGGKGGASTIGAEIAFGTGLGKNDNKTEGKEE